MVEKKVIEERTLGLLFLLLSGLLHVGGVAAALSGSTGKPAILPPLRIELVAWELDLSGDPVPLSQSHADISRAIPPRAGLGFKLGPARSMSTEPPMPAPAPGSLIPPRPAPVSPHRNDESRTVRPPAPEELAVQGDLSASAAPAVSWEEEPYAGANGSLTEGASHDYRSVFGVEEGRSGSNLLEAQGGAAPAGQGEGRVPEESPGVGAFLAHAVPRGQGVGGTPPGEPPEYREYIAVIRQKLFEALAYPMAARRRSLTGTVLLSVLIRADGTIGPVSILESSGHGILDEAARRTVRDLGPFPFPRDLSPRDLLLYLPVSYQLR